MKALLASGILAVLTFGVILAADPPMPKPEKEHEWLKQFVGDWNMEGECKMPGGMTVKSKGSESVKALGGFWITSELKGEFGGVPMTCQMTVGYDPVKKQYIGTWVDSMNSHMWHYVGSIDSTGKILTLEAEGPSFTDEEDVQIQGRDRVPRRRPSQDEIPDAGGRRPVERIHVDGSQAEEVTGSRRRTSPRGAVSCGGRADTRPDRPL